MVRSKRKFGDVGTEHTFMGDRKVMWLTDSAVFILANAVDDDPSEAVVGDVTWQLVNTVWNKPETTENE